MTPKTMQAIKIVSAGKAEVQTAPVPKLRDHYILVKNTAVAINPTDWKHIDYHPTTGATVGCDFVGTVVALGPKVTKDYKVGDRIAGVNHGSNQTESEDGAFGEYCVVKEGLTFKVPEQMSDEQAATVGVAVTTIASGLYDKLGMPMPGSGKNGEGQWLLVYGGSTAMGSLAIQSAVLSGYKVVATCSPRNFDFVKSLGAEAVFDYNDSDCSKKMNEHTGDKLSLVFDCVAEGDSTKICMAALSSDGGKIAALLPVSQENSRTNVTNEFVNAYTCIGEAYTKFGKYNEANPKVYESCSQFWEVAGKLFAEGKLVAHPQKVNLEGEGLEGVLKGLQIMRDGKVSGFKLVYRIDGPK